MKRKWILFLAAGLGLGAAGLAANQGLVRIHPPGSGAAGELGTDQVEAWRARLVEPDLDLREQAFERALQDARRDPALRAALQQWAGSNEDPQLAWTCRLLLREVRTSPWTSGPGSAGVFGAPGLLRLPRSLDPDELMRQMEELHGSLDQLLEDQMLQAGLDGDLGGVPGASVDSRAEGLKLNLGPDGVDCELTTEEDGKIVMRHFQAASLEELLEQHPELRERLEMRGFGSRSWALPGMEWAFPRSLDPSGARTLRSPSGMRSPSGSRADAPVRTDILGVVVGFLAADRAAQLGLEAGRGLSVERVEPGTIAAALGVRRGHVLVELNGHPLRTSEDISAALAARPADGDVRLVLLDRYGQRRTRVWTPEPSADAEEAVPGDALKPLDGGGQR